MHMEHARIRRQILTATRAEGVGRIATRLRVSRLALLGFLADTPRNQATDILIAQRFAEADFLEAKTETRRAG
jgi:hypothetical protein